MIKGSPSRLFSAATLRAALRMAVSTIVTNGSARAGFSLGDLVEEAFIFRDVVDFQPAFIPACHKARGMQSRIVERRRICKRKI